MLVDEKILNAWIYVVYPELRNKPGESEIDVSVRSHLPSPYLTENPTCSFCREVQGLWSPRKT